MKLEMLHALTTQRDEARSEVARLRLALQLITDRSGYFVQATDPWSHAVMREAMLSIDSTARRALRTTDAQPPAKP